MAAAAARRPRLASDTVPRSADEIDENRHKTVAYEYLCHLEEARSWLEACLQENLPSAAELEENLRNGVYLAKLANFIAPEILPIKKIYDFDQERYKVAGLQFRHTDNINQWLKVLKTTELPITFHPETTDVYDKKNMPRVIYCIHALSTQLFKLGRAPLIQDLYGKVKFTDEEINVMSKELQRYGIVMPAFKKIGGLLSSNLEEDVASLHAAVININKAIDNNKDLKGSLLNPTAKLKYVLPHLLPTYYSVLMEAKKIKLDNVINHSTDDSYIADIYDELLTQLEIQGYITAVNTTDLLEKMFDSTYIDEEYLLNALLSPWLQLKNINQNNKKMYHNTFVTMREDIGNMSINRIDCNTIFQSIINEGNSMGNLNNMIENGIKKVNKALDENDVNGLHAAFKNLNSHLDKLCIEEFSMPLFYEELQLIKMDYGCELSCDDIIKNSHTLSTVAQISKIIDIRNPEILWKALTSNVLDIEGLCKELSHNYYIALKDARQAKQRAALPCTLLTQLDIQDCIDSVNNQDCKSQELIRKLQSLNEAIINNDEAELFQLLSCGKLSTTKLHKIDSALCMRLFKKRLLKKNDNELWMDDIQNVMNDINNEITEVKGVSKKLMCINLALLKDDNSAFLDGLKQLDYIKLDDKPYLMKLFQIFQKSLEKKMSNQCPWIMHQTASGINVYINIETDARSWNPPKGYSNESSYLSMKDTINLLKEFNIYKDKVKRRTHIDCIIILQAHVRGFLVRRDFRRRLHFEKNIEHVIKIQSKWKSILARRRYIQMLKSKPKPEDKWLYYTKREKQIIKVQALWRGQQARRAFLSLFKANNPSFKIVKHFVPILAFSTEDYEKEMELQSLRSEAVQLIRKNQSLAKQVDNMDIKIGLLVQNRITLQDVLAHRKKLNDFTKNTDSTLHVGVTNNPNEKISNSKPDGNNTVRGLNSLTKESRKLLDGYQQLFYLLQTNPKYLSKLLFLLPKSRTNQLLQNIILTVYNYGSNSRDEYLLLKLLRHCLEEEIVSMVDRPMDIITGSPMVLKIVVQHSRHMHGLESLRDILGPLVEKMLNSKNMCIETSPIDIYKAWRNQMESCTGQVSSLPHVVTQEQALSYPEVNTRLKQGLETLKDMVTMFLERIIKCCDKLPFSLTFMARVLYHELKKKFPQTPEKDILKIIGHLIYYQFINAAIVAPDAFNIVTLPHDRPLSTDQRRNLASVAKILHFSASKKGFGDESAHLQCLNTFIIECHEKMKEFFGKCCQGPTLEENYSMNEYSEATMLHKPCIYISVQEICDIHNLILEYEKLIAPDPLDKLHDILDIVGSSEVDELPIANLISSNTEICLSLVDKNEPLPDEKSNLNKLFIKTKELCVSLLPFLEGEHLLESLCIGTTKEQQEQYNTYIQQRLYSGMIKSNECMTLREHIAQLRKYLNTLDEEGYVSRVDGYQDIINSIARDLCNKGKYRRDQLQALQMMKKTKKALDEKSKFYQDQCYFFNQYINKCLENLNAGKRAVHAINRKGGKSVGKIKTKMSVKCTGSKLHDKGVILDIEGLSVSQYKNVLFEISPTDQNGVFSIKGKFMGIPTDEIEIDIQNLLQLQYDGCSIMNIFDRAKINVNLLLYFLNSKFYSKNK